MNELTQNSKLMKHSLFTHYFQCFHLCFFFVLFCLLMVRMERNIHEFLMSLLEVMERRCGGRYPLNEEVFRILAAKTTLLKLSICQVVVLNRKTSKTCRSMCFLYITKLKRQTKPVVREASSSKFDTKAISI